MDKWEYNICTFKGLFSDLKSKLNKEGAWGWELVQCVPQYKGDSLIPVYECIFKRRLKECDND